MAICPTPLAAFCLGGQQHIDCRHRARGEMLGVYRKTHIPDGVGYQEKYYSNPGDTGFRVWDTKHGKVGFVICWDQWFPETARCLLLHRR